MEVYQSEPTTSGPRLECLSNVSPLDNVDVVQSRDLVVVPKDDYQDALQLGKTSAERHLQA